MSERLTELSFEHLGVKLRIRRIPQMLVQDWYASLPEPPPVPTQEVDYGGKKVMEENPSHPSYAAAMQEYNFSIGMRAIEFSIQRGIAEVSYDGHTFKGPNLVDVEAVKELRDWAQTQQPPTQLPADDKVLYVSRILLPELADLVKLREAVFGRFEPTEKEIDRSVKRFRTEVQRS